MRYSQTHKQETRAKVLKAAAGALRARGPDGVAVAEIMAEVGLTHGGFYAHFPSKEALVAAAIDEAFGQSRGRFDRLLSGLPPAEAFARFVDLYVSREHRDVPARGCPIATLASELPRQGAAVRAAYERGVQALIARVAAWLPAEHRDQAASLVAEMAGAVVLSRGISNPDAADRLLADARHNLKTRMERLQ